MPRTWLTRGFGQVVTRFRLFCAAVRDDVVAWVEWSARLGWVKRGGCRPIRVDHLAASTDVREFFEIGETRPVTV